MSGVRRLCLPGLLAGTSLCGVLLACGRPAGPAVPAASTAGSPSAQPIALEETLPPNTVRCGVDDAPAPVGRTPSGAPHLDVLGLLPIGFALPDPGVSRPALPSVTLSPSIAGNAISVSALTAVFQDCAGQLDAKDAGEHTLTLTFGSSGVLQTSRPTSRDGDETGPTTFARCLADRACRLPAAPGLAGQTTTARVRATLSPPAFRGRVEATLLPIAALSTAWVHPNKRVQIHLDEMKALLETTGQACAQKLPPADDVSLLATFSIEKGALRSYGFQRMIGHGESIRVCVEAVANERLGRVRASPHAKELLNVLVQISVEPPLDLPGRGDP